MRCLKVSLIDKITAVECDEERINKLYYDIVSKGKSSDKLKKVSKYKKDNPKYGDPNALNISCSVRRDEAVFLYKIVKYFKVKSVFEIGTWFGTSAAVMIEAIGDGIIYTCDKNDAYVLDDFRIKFRHCYSFEYLRRLLKNKIKVDMVFADGKFEKKDGVRIMKLLNQTLFVTHDYIKGEKGWRCVDELCKILPKDSYEFYSDGIMALIVGKDLQI